MSENQPAEVEIIEATPATIPPAAIDGPTAAPITLFGTTNPKEVIKNATETATALTEILEARTLYKDIRNRRHVLVEGWTLLGSMLGVFPVTVWTRRIADADGSWKPPVIDVQTKTLHSKWCKKGKSGHDQHQGCDTYTKETPIIVEAGNGGWEARVEAHTLGGQVVGSAESECRWDEFVWRDRDSHAVRSMAQTRATAKALRMPLGFIVQLAGFEATPAEEMPAEGYGESQSNGERPAEPGHQCPACNAGVWDNREDNKARLEAGDKAWPAFKCKNKECTAGKDSQPWAAWDPHVFEAPEVRAKHAMVKLVAAKKAAWKVYYPAEDPSYLATETETMAAIHEGDDPAQMAGALWNRLMAAAGVGLVFNVEEEDRPNDRDLRIILEAAKLALDAAGEDSENIIAEHDALEDAIITVDQREAEDASHMSDYG